MTEQPYDGRDWRVAEVERTNLLCCTINAVLVGFRPNVPELNLPVADFFCVRANEKNVRIAPVGTKVPVPRSQSGLSPITAMALYPAEAVLQGHVGRSVGAS